jgi:hypothetical protein
MRKIGTVPIFLLLVGCAPADPVPPAVIHKNVACTMEAKGCPDGSYVGRDPAQGCAFKPCPSANEDRRKAQ